MSELYHHGVKGMKWGVRHDPQRSGKMRRIRNGISTGLTAAGMHYSQGYSPGRDSWQYTKKNKKVGGNKVDVSIAKNRQTRQVALDYHNLTNKQFRGKYKTTKKRFAKRYNKTGGDTYSLGLKKQARALNMLRKAYGTDSRAYQRAVQTSVIDIKGTNSYSRGKRKAETIMNIDGQTWHITGDAERFIKRQKEYERRNR